MELESERGPVASDGKPQVSSLFDELTPREKKILAVLKQDALTHIDEIIERLEPEVSSSEVFTALFELELSGKIKQLPGKHYVKSF
jgi:DNA processing protein